MAREGNVVYKKNDASKTNIDQTINNGWLGLGSTYTYQDGDYAPENYLYEAGDTSQQRKSVGDTATQTGYCYNYTDSNVIDQDSTLWKTLFDGTTSDKNYAKSYWLASPGAVVNSSYSSFGHVRARNGGAGTGFYAFYSQGYVNDGWNAVRPVVSLKSNITESDIAITTGIESDWTTSLENNWVGENISSGQVLENTGN